MPDTSTKLGLSLPLENEIFSLNVYRNNLEEIDTKVVSQTELANLAGIGRTTETVKGNAENIATHIGSTSAHGATSEVSANSIISRDSNGRAKVAAPSTNEDIARKDTVDAVQSNLTAHLADNTKQIPHIGTTTNISNDYSVTTTETILANHKFTVKFNVASTGVATLNISSIGSAKGIKKPGGTDASLKIGVYTLFYDGTNFQLLGEGGEYGTVGAAQVLTGYTVGTDNGLVNGTMPNRAGDTAALASSVSGTTLKLRASAGYRDGVDDNVTITDANFTEANIKNGVVMLGKTGTLQAQQAAFVASIKNQNMLGGFTVVAYPAFGIVSDLTDYYRIISNGGFTITFQYNTAVNLSNYSYIIVFSSSNALNGNRNQFYFNVNTSSEVWTDTGSVQLMHNYANDLVYTTSILNVSAKSGLHYLMFKGVGIVDYSPYVNIAGIVLVP